MANYSQQIKIDSKDFSGKLEHATSETQIAPNYEKSPDANSCKKAVKKPQKAAIQPLKALTTKDGDSKQRKQIGEKSFKCKVCSSEFFERCKLTAHAKTHVEGRSFKCDLCPNSYTRKQSLTSHVKRAHTRKKSFRCSVCPSAFVFPADLKLHERIHTGEKPYQCHICPSAFNQKSNLRTHQKTHSEEKGHECDICRF